MQSTITVFRQLLQLIPRHRVNKLSSLHKGPRKHRTFSRWDHLVHLLHFQLAGKKSLRDAILTMNTSSKHLYHLGTQSVAKSTLADANNNRPYTFFEDLFGELYQACSSKATRHGFSFDKKLFSLDATVIDLCLPLFPWAKFRSSKAGIKCHTMLDHNGVIPSLVKISEARCHDITMARTLDLPNNSIIVFDRGYNDFDWFKKLCRNKLVMVTRLKKNTKYHILERHPVDRSTPVRSDQIIQIQEGPKALILRRIGYRDPDTNKHYSFLTNEMTMPAQTIADIYKDRWKVEIFFKELKQNLKIKTFLGRSKNAVYSQIYVALIAYLLLSYYRFLSKIKMSLQYLARLMRNILFQPSEILDSIKPMHKTKITIHSRCLLSLA